MFDPKLPEVHGEPETPLQDPNAPKKPSGAYIFFCNDKRKEVKEKNPDFGVADIGRELGKMWKDVSDDDRKVPLSARLSTLIVIMNSICEHLRVTAAPHAGWLEIL